MTRTALKWVLSASLLGGLALPQIAGAQADSAATLAQLDASLPGDLINDPTSLDWATLGEGLKVTSVQGEQIPGGRAAAHFAIRTPGQNPWSIQAYVPLTAAIAQGDTVTFGFWARAAVPPSGSRTGQLSVRVQQNVDPWPGFGDTRLAIEPEWKWYEVSATATTAVSASNGVLVFQLGGARQEIEIGQTIVVKGVPRIIGDGARPQEPLPPQLEGKGTLVSKPDSREWAFGGPDTSRTPREDRSIYLRRAVQFVSPAASATASDIQALVPLSEAIKTGDKLLVAVAVKTVSAATEDGKAIIGIRIQENREPFAGFAENRFKVGPNWQLVQIRTTATMDLPAGAGMVALHFAGAEQSVDLGPVYVLKEPAAP